MLNNAQMIRMLHDHKVRPSVHRLAVLEYVANRMTHPTAEEIFSNIILDFPSVSKTTVYNSLHTLVEAGIIKELDMENSSTRYDLALQTPHSHFRCRRCGTIFDMALPAGLDGIVKTGFKVDSTELYFAGICPGCAETNTEN